MADKGQGVVPSGLFGGICKLTSKMGGALEDPVGRFPQAQEIKASQLFGSRHLDATDQREIIERFRNGLVRGSV